MENYIISFPKHFHYCNKGSVCFADTLARESMQKASEVPVQKKSNLCAYTDAHLAASNGIFKILFP